MNASTLVHVPCRTRAPGCAHMADVAIYTVGLAPGQVAAEVREANDAGSECQPCAAARWTARLNITAPAGANLEDM